MVRSDVLPERKGKTAFVAIAKGWLTKDSIKHGEKELLFDADGAQVVPKSVVPEAEQEENESRRLWSKVTAAIKRNDQDAATDEKNKVEEKQRDLAKQRDESGEKWSPKYFAVKNGEHRALFT